ncbi:hypothetical protein SASPL_146658 [Salvia splendens]|uniref:Uncharacterized protein n=1 Tax=Salvia splendens TaxID=180675 RepID=A0A8X8WE10_SALSN|nr:hypothetical protein SASPL_146658 [Salvia splendens]
MLCLSDDVIIEVADQETAADLWTKLESPYMTKSLTNRLLLKQRLFRLRMHEEDEDAALILLVSLPESYKNFVESFMTGKETLPLEDVRYALHIREDRQQATSSATENLASGLSVTDKGQKKFGQKKQNSKGSKGPKGPKSDDICRYFKEPGHWKADCPKIKKKLGKKEDANGSATVAEADDANLEEELALVANEQPHCNDVWILDSGASYHLCPHREYFTTYEQIDRGNVTMANSEGGVMRILKGSKVVLTALKWGTLYVLRGSIMADSADIASSETSIAIDRARRTGVKPPLRYGFEDMMAYALQVANEGHAVSLDVKQSGDCEVNSIEGFLFSVGFRGKSPLPHHSRPSLSRDCVRRRHRRRRADYTLTSVPFLPSFLRFRIIRHNIFVHLSSSQTEQELSSSTSIPKKQVRVRDHAYDAYMEIEKKVRKVLKFQDHSLAAQPHPLRIAPLQHLPPNRIQAVRIRPLRAQIPRRLRGIRAPGPADPLLPPHPKSPSADRARKSIPPPPDTGGSHPDKEAADAVENRLEHIRISLKEFGLPDDFESSVILNHPQFFRLFDADEARSK